jgi:hypothetical protein
VEEKNIMLKPHLVITPSVPVWNDNDSLIFDRKFYDGIALYVQLWPGDVTCIITKTNSSLPAFGVKIIFHLKWCF